ncbi:hypothetical protein NFI96_020494, partial [Prochilodus magdalenae]
MDWNALTCFLLLSVYIYIYVWFAACQSVMAFNIESSAWKTFIQNQDTAFGYKVIQKDPERMKKLIRFFSFNLHTEPPEAVNMSLGLSMVKDPRSLKIMACGPTIPKNCKSTTTYNGMCLTIGNGNEPVPRELRDCPPPAQTDIAFLLDGSGSVNSNDFSNMKQFVITLVRGLLVRDVRFAVAQYSDYCEIHVDFTSYLDDNQIWRIRQMGSFTNTAGGINKLVNELFARRARQGANRVMIVITDGVSTTPGLEQAAQNAERNNIIRYAIGVGNAFNNQRAEGELNTIASDPDQDYKFKVDSFNVLDKILKTLETNIIAIEGTQTSGDSTRMEFAQDGFSAAFVPNGNVILSAVGAYQWKGGYQEYKSGQPYKFQSGSEHDSYLGYSMTVATWDQEYAVLGAPRHKHIGAVVMTSLRTSKKIQLDPPESQIGAYFGAELCAVKLNAQSFTDLLLVSAPLHTQDGREGKVFVYSKTSAPQIKMTLEGMAGQRGRFGSSLASPADLNGDGIRDVVVGAPMEENGQGSIYIFNGRTQDISPTYSQRIRGSSVKSGLRFFGLSLSESALDHSGDNLKDIAVGSKGGVILLRSRPIVTLETKVTYNPLKIPTKSTDCANPLETTLHLCFTMSGYSTQITDLTANINYSLKLDAKRPNSRATFSEKKRDLNAVMKIELKENCKTHKFYIEACTEDALNPLSNELTFTFEGLPSTSAGNLRPVLHPDIKTSSDHNLDFEIDCGPDKVCIDNLKVDFNFSGHSDIKVGIMQDMNVTVFVENTEENSYNSHVKLKYPFGLSFRRVTTKQGRVECVSVDSEEISKLGETICYISKPILRQNSLAVFEITYSISKESNFDRMVTFSATVDSGNDKHSHDSKLTLSKNIGVKYAIYAALIRHENSSIHINFTAGKNDLEKLINQIFKVENDLRDVNLTVLIRVPIKLGDKDIWANKNLQIPGCSFDRDEHPTIPDFLPALKNKKQPVVNCSVAMCRLFKCNAHLSKREAKLYNISANVSSGWIEQTGLRTAVFELVSTATLEYDTNKYVFFSSDSLHTAPIGKINTQVEVYEEKTLLKEIIGGVIGGLLLLALITAGLYKAGFFKSQYKQMLEEAGAGAEGSGEAGLGSGDTQVDVSEESVPIKEMIQGATGGLLLWALIAADLYK